MIFAFANDKPMVGSSKLAKLFGKHFRCTKPRIAWSKLPTRNELERLGIFTFRRSSDHCFKKIQISLRWWRNWERNGAIWPTNEGNDISLCILKIESDSSKKWNISELNMLHKLKNSDNLTKWAINEKMLKTILINKKLIPVLYISPNQHQF